MPQELPGMQTFALAADNLTPDEMTYIWTRTQFKLGLGRAPQFNHLSERIPA